MEQLAKKILKYRWYVIAIFGILSIWSISSVDQLKFSFDFEQLFPQGDSDLIFYKEKMMAFY